MTRTPLLIVTGLALLLCNSIVYAQGKAKPDSSNTLHSAISAVVKSYGDSVVVRWAPGRSGAWMAYNSIGYIVDRRRIDNIAPNAKVVFERITSAPLKAWTKEEWFSRSSKTNTYAGVAAQCLYGTLSVPNPQGPDVLLMAATDLGNRYAFALLAADMNTIAANGLGLRIADRDIQRSGEYVYRIYPAKQDSLYTVDTAVVYVKASDVTVVPTPSAISATGTEKSVMLQWSIHATQQVSGYWVDRKDKSGKVLRLTQTPYVPVASKATDMIAHPTFTDTLVTLGESYTYMIYAIDAFADVSEAATVIGAPRDITPPLSPAIQAPTVFGGNIVRLEWASMTSVKDLAGFTVSRSPSQDGPFIPLHISKLDKSAEGYVDTAATADEPWYVVEVSDTSGNLSRTLPFYVTLVDTVQPAPPVGVTGLIDTTGLVFLTWKTGPEKDLYGYRVLWANDSNHVFTQRTNIIQRDTFFIDSIALNTSTKYVYYKIVAVDTRQYHSEPSAMLQLRRPDTVAPESPVISYMLVTDSTVHIEFAPSTANDVMWHVVERTFAATERTQESWTAVDTLAHNASMFTDTTVKMRTKYLYRIVAVDSNGIKSAPSVAGIATPYDAGNRDAVRSVSARFDSTTHTNRISWLPGTAPKEKHWFGIYRAVDDYELRLYRSVKSSDASFTDNELVGAGRYRYAVKVISAIGESPLSEEIHVDVP